MRFKEFKHLPVVALVAVGLALAACGGGDTVTLTDQQRCEADGGTWADGTCTTAAELAEVRALNDAKMAARNAATEADTAADGAEAAANAQTANKAADEASYALAQNAAQRARAAANDAAAANTAAQAATTAAAAEDQQAIAERHQRTAETERNNAVKYAGMVMSAHRTAEQKKSADAKKAAANKVAATKKAAIATEGASATTTAARPFDLTADPADLTAPTAGENYVLTVKHTGSAVQVTVLDGTLPADNDPMYKQVATFGNGQMLVREIGTDREIIVVHTDIEAPDDVAFSSMYTLTVDRDTDTTAMDTYAVLAADNEKIASPMFPSGESTTRTFVEYVDTTVGRKGEFSGTFDGASGTYRCVASGGCTVSTNAMGKFNTLIDGQWQFTPAAGATVKEPDDDYMTYGFWLDTTTKDDAIASYDTVQTFAMSSAPLASSLGTVTGMATYEGGAAGVYVHESKNEDGTLDEATSGRFTADVSLTAYFAETTLRNDNTISGTISKFDLDDGPDNSWKVDVSASFTDAGLLENGVASGMTGDNGSLSGQFHGPAAQASDAPGSLVGEFNANFVNGAVAGAYGARKK